jgi:hypothetical protein
LLEQLIDGLARDLAEPRDLSDRDAGGSSASAARSEPLGCGAVLAGSECASASGLA